MQNKHIKKQNICKLTFHSLTVVQPLLLLSSSPDNQVNSKHKDIKENVKTNLKPLHEPAHTNPSTIVDGEDAIHPGWMTQTL